MHGSSGSQVLQGFPSSHDNQSGEPGPSVQPLALFPITACLLLGNMFTIFAYCGLLKFRLLLPFQRQPRLSYVSEPNFPWLSERSHHSTTPAALPCRVRGRSTTMPGPEGGLLMLCIAWVALLVCLFACWRVCFTFVCLLVCLIVCLFVCLLACLLVSFSFLFLFVCLLVCLFVG